METLGIEFEIAKNQIAIDFDNLEKEEESEVLPKDLIKVVSHEWIKEETLFVVIRAEKEELAPKLYDLSLCGKTMTDWVLMAGAHCQKCVINDIECIIEGVRDIDTDKKYIAAFYSDTPLLDRQSFYKVMDYFSSKSINFLQLTRGFIIKTDFLRNSPNFMQGGCGGYEMPTLLRADNAENIKQIYSVLNQKIISYHRANGVIILGENVYIDADVEIEGGAVIYPNNIISGQSIIGYGAILESGNIISNSIVGQYVKLKGCYIENSKIADKSKVENASKIINQQI